MRITSPLTPTTPGFFSEPEATVVKTGNSMTLTCDVSGDEPDSVMWYKDNIPIVSASAIFYVPSNYDSLALSKVGYSA